MSRRMATQENHSVICRFWVTLGARNEVEGAVENYCNGVPGLSWRLTKSSGWFQTDYVLRLEGSRSVVESAKFDLERWLRRMSGA